MLKIGEKFKFTKIEIRKLSKLTNSKLLKALKEVKKLDLVKLTIKTFWRSCTKAIL